MQTIPENRKISPSLVFFTIHGMQFGIGVLGFQRIIAQTAGYDSWISIIIAGIGTGMIMWMIFKILEIGKQDLGENHQFVFGKWIGALFNTFFILYFTLYVITIIRNYIEIVQVWMFEDLNIFLFALLFLLLCIYIVNGGFRTVTGMMFFSVALPSYLIILFGFTIPFADFRHFLPLFDHSTKEIITASKQMSLTYIGYETFLVYSPFVKDQQKSKKWAYGSILVSSLMFLYTAVISFAYYTEEQIQKYIWATLTTWKIVQLPIVERFEYIGIANWCLIILPNTSLALWCGSRMIKNTFKISQRKGVLLISVISLIIVPFFKTRNQINKLSYLLGNIGFLVDYIYIPSLLILIWLVKKVKKKHEKNTCF
ncbi:GerAB/ArcD/ProY family transporter [Heyndrickxia sp. NPDC080065]|uniref:GerAB/ArcD/ProY family transporter n=1 Tax=Heyndrickxia sp. NPDC080065 TaxID=3390568 RepID=UPI003CFE1F5A